MSAKREQFLNLSDEKKFSVLRTLCGQGCPRSRQVAL